MGEGLLLGEAGVIVPIDGAAGGVVSVGPGLATLTVVTAQLFFSFFSLTLPAASAQAIRE